MSFDHFQGKNVVDHLKEARLRGSIATAEIHGVETPGHLAAGADAAKETVAVFLFLWILFPDLSMKVLFFFAMGWLLWKFGRSAFLGWARLERLHRLIEEERWEIQHHRHQEREELTELYRAKGFTGKLLEEAIDVLMADDDRLLRVMLEEELGLSLEAYEHPLKQGLGAAVGVAIAACLLFLGMYLHPHYGFLGACLLTLIIAATIAARFEKNRVLPAVIWTISLVVLSAGVIFFLAQLKK
jgi:vacuolar iron transporter family protein